MVTLATLTCCSKTWIGSNFEDVDREQLKLAKAERAKKNLEKRARALGKLRAGATAAIITGEPVDNGDDAVAVDPDEEPPATAEELLDDDDEDVQRPGYECETNSQKEQRVIVPDNFVAGSTELKVKLSDGRLVMITFEAGVTAGTLLSFTAPSVE